VESSSPNTTHDLLLALAGRVDDDLLAWARELVAVGEDAHAVEMLTATLTADRVTLPHPVRSRLVEMARAARIELDADAELPAPTPEEATEHRFGTHEPATGRVSAALTALPTRLLQGCRVRLTHRLTAAGSAPGPLPHPVLIVEVEPGSRRPDMLSYQLAVALERSGVPTAVEVLTAGTPVSAYHAEALRSADPVRLEGRSHAETTVAVPALPTRRPGGRRSADPSPAGVEPWAPDAERVQRHRLAGATQPIAAATPFGESSSDTPLFESPAEDAARRSETHDRGEDPPEERRSPRSGRLTAVPSVFDEPAPAASADGYPSEDFPPGADRDSAFGRDETGRDGSDRGDGDRDEFHPGEFGRDRRAGAAHRAGGGPDEPPRPSPRPKPRPSPVIPLHRTTATGPTPIPLLRRGSGARPLSPVGSTSDPHGNDDPLPRSDADYDPLRDPLSRPLLDPLLDPTPPLTGPLGLVGGPQRLGPVAEESWSGDWLSGAWAASSAGPLNGEQGGRDEVPAPAPEPPPAPRPVGRRSARHRYLRTPDDPPPQPPPDSRAVDTGAQPAVPTESGSGPIPLPPAGTGPAAVEPHEFTRPAIPLPAAESREPEPRPPERPEIDVTLGLRPESIARLGEADLDLLAKLQAELRNGRSSRPEAGAANGSGPHAETSGYGTQHDVNGYPAPYDGNGHGTNGYANGRSAGGDRPPSNGMPLPTADTTGNDPSGTGRNGSARPGSGRRGPFVVGPSETRAPEPSDDEGPPDIAG
jgi:hypothetical protein